MAVALRGPGAMAMGMAVVSLALIAGSCTTRGLAFREDRRLAFLTPGHREEVTLPVTVSWTMSPDFVLTGLDGSATHDTGLFAVLVDVDAPPPGEGLDWFSRDDANCQRLADCPSADWFRERGVFATTDTRLVLDAVRPLRGVETTRQRDFHEVTVVLLDGRGRRIGESSWTRVFKLVDADE